MLGDKLRERKEFYCERCRYKFKSIRFNCPYCNQCDKLTKPVVNVNELLG